MEPQTSQAQEDIRPDNAGILERLKQRFAGAAVGTLNRVAGAPAGVTNEMLPPRETILSRVMDAIKTGGGRVVEATNPRPPAPAVATVRGVDIDKKDFDETFRPILFGEVSNRSGSKKDLEARVILNTAINRLVEHRNRGTGKGFKDILTQPNQYQAYGGEQYNLYLSGDGEKLDVKKKQEVDRLLDSLWTEMVSGQLEDNTRGAFYYIHNDDGSITYDDLKPLFE